MDTATAKKQVVVKTNQIELTIIDSVDENGVLLNPTKFIANKLGVSEREVENKIRQLKKLKMLVARRKTNSPCFTYLKVNESLVVRFGSLPEQITQSNGAKPKVEPENKSISPEKRILIVLDFENIYLNERFSGQRISLPKLKDYFRKFGVIYSAEVFVPHHYFKEQNQRQIDYIWSSGWMAFHCPNSVKDKDQVDNLMMDRVRQQTFMFPETEVWIVSKDADFLRLVEINKDRGLHTIKLVDPFDIPEIMGYEEKELNVLLSRQVANIIRSTKSLTTSALLSESDIQRLFRYTIAWLKEKKSPLSYNNHHHFVADLNKHLNVVAADELQPHRGFPVNVASALKELGIIRQLSNKNRYCLEILFDHELFKLEPPQ